MEAQGGILLEEKEGMPEEREASSRSPVSQMGEGRPDPEVAEMPKRRKYTAEYKLRILEEADACTHPGEIGALLRREGLYSSHITRWRRNLQAGILEALSPEKRGPKPAPENPLQRRLAELERENARLKKKLEAAETIIEVQKKVSGLLGIYSEATEEKR